jgi:hypothetical protein
LLENGFIKLYRSLTKWEWYHDMKTCRVFVHLLLTANYEPHKFEGITVGRGQRIASYATLAEETGLSVQSVRTSIKRLKSTHEITSLPTSNYTVFTVVNYDFYQSAQQANQQVDNKPITSAQQAPNNNERKIRKNKKEKEKRVCVSESNSLFERFWEEYPRHAKRTEALTEFEKYLQDSRLEKYDTEERVNFLIEAVRAWKSSEQWQAENGRYIPNAANWLKDEKYTQKYLRELKATQTEVWSGYPELGADLKHD